MIEAVVEDLEAKRTVLARLDEVCAGAALLASNTSSLSIDSIGLRTARRGRVVGMHFFNPVVV